VAARPEFSAQTLSVLVTLCHPPSQWQHGYALAKQTGLKSGTLYPILIRLAEQAAAARAGTGKPRARVRPGQAAPGAVAGMTS
jgi:hypothetical protein